jgi:hypothetical protein
MPPSWAGFNFQGSIPAYCIGPGATTVEPAPLLPGRPTGRRPEIEKPRFFPQLEQPRDGPGPRPGGPGAFGSCFSVEDGDGVPPAGGLNRKTAALRPCGKTLPIGAGQVGPVS